MFSQLGKFQQQLPKSSNEDTSVVKIGEEAEFKNTPCVLVAFWPFK